VSEGGWGLFLAWPGFAVLGYMVSNISGESNWGIIVGVQGIVCYLLGWAVGWGAASRKR
jgi:hypothetical protein